MEKPSQELTSLRRPFLFLWDQKKGKKNNKNKTLKPHLFQGIPVRRMAGWSYNVFSDSH